MEYNPEDNEALPLKDLVVLLADDEVRLRQIVVMMVEELGARVIAVDSCEEALSIYETSHSEIDLVMLDLRMGGMSGESAFYHLISKYDDVRIVLSSGVRPEQHLLDSLNKHGCAFIEKPFDMDQLSNTLSTIARRGKSSEVC